MSELAEIEEARRLMRLEKKELEELRIAIKRETKALEKERMRLEKALAESARVPAQPKAAPSLTNQVRKTNSGKLMVSQRHGRSKSDNAKAGAMKERRSNPLPAALDTIPHSKAKPGKSPKGKRTDSPRGTSDAIPAPPKKEKAKKKSRGGLSKRLKRPSRSATSSDALHDIHHDGKAPSDPEAIYGVMPTKFTGNASAKGDGDVIDDAGDVPSVNGDAAGGEIVPADVPLGTLWKFAVMACSHLALGSVKTKDGAHVVPGLFSRKWSGGDVTHALSSLHSLEKARAIELAQKMVDASMLSHVVKSSKKKKDKSREVVSPRFSAKKDCKFSQQVADEAYITSSREYRELYFPQPDDSPLDKVQADGRMEEFVPAAPEMMSFKYFKRTYKILVSGKSAAGSSGTVVLGQNVKSKQVVAIKRIPDCRFERNIPEEEKGEKFDTKWAIKRKNLLREVSACRMTMYLPHPSIVGIRGLYVDKESIIFVMELMKAGSLETMYYHTLNKMMPEEHVRRVAENVLLGLYHLHSIGIVHRDIKPANILCPSPERYWDCKICDFGISSLQLTQSEDKMTSLVGSLPYIAPEAWDRNGYDANVDVYAVGAMVYELLFGSFHVKAPPNTGAMAKKCKTLDWEWPSTFVRGGTEISVEAREFIKACLSRASDRPPASMILRDKWIAGSDGGDAMSLIKQRMKFTKASIRVLEVALGKADPLLLRSAEPTPRDNPAPQHEVADDSPLSGDGDDAPLSKDDDAQRIDGPKHVPPRNDMPPAKTHPAAKPDAGKAVDDWEIDVSFSIPSITSSEKGLSPALTPSGVDAEIGSLSIDGGGYLGGGVEGLDDLDDLVHSYYEQANTSTNVEAVRMVGGANGEVLVQRRLSFVGTPEVRRKLSLLQTEELSDHLDSEDVW